MQVHERRRFGLFEVDLSARTISKRGTDIHIQEKPFLILSMLLERPGEIVTREELRKKLWPADTFVEFNDGVNTAIGKLRSTLGDSAERPTFIETVRGRGYRFIATLAEESASNWSPEHAMDSAVSPRIGNLASDPITRGYASKTFAICLLLLVAILSVFFYKRSRPAVSLTEKDTIVLADFSNSTDDPIFEDTLREALATQLQESPFLSLVPDKSLRETLSLMGRSPDLRFSADVANDLCHRVGSKAIVSGSISHIGSNYILTLNANNCATGESFAREEVRSKNKDEVLKSLDSAATNLRRHLGESLSTIQKFETPIEQATTSSLEALRAFSLGRKAINTQNFSLSVPMFQQAIRLDPNFAMAYALLGTAYWNLGELNLAVENTNKAYSLRDRISAHESWYIESHYYQNVLRDFEKARQVYEVWAEMYPRDFVPRHNPGDTYMVYGNYEKALSAELDALRVDPANGLGYSNLILYYLALNRLQDAEGAVEEATKKHLEGAIAGTPLYYMAFLRSDQAGMERQLSWAKDNPGNEDWMLSLHSDTAAYYGHLSRARQLSAAAVGSAINSHEREAAANWQANEALREAEFGNRARARQAGRHALALFPGTDVQTIVAMTYARIGDIDEAKRLITALTALHPRDTMLHVYWRPAISAALELQRGKATKAIDVLRLAAPYELGATAPTAQSASLYPVYLRGEAYLALHQPNLAAKEFQKYLDHRGAVKNLPLGSLALMRLAHAHALSGDASRARDEYVTFFRLWKDADPDIPLLKQAKAEYARVMVR